MGGQIKVTCKNQGYLSTLQGAAFFLSFYLLSYADKEPTNSLVLYSDWFWLNYICDLVWNKSQDNRHYASPCNYPSKGGNIYVLLNER